MLGTLKYEELIGCLLPGTLDNGENWGNQVFECHLVQSRKISLGFSIFKILSGATMKALEGRIRPAGRMFHTPVIEVS